MFIKRALLGLFISDSGSPESINTRILLNKLERNERTEKRKKVKTKIYEIKERFRSSRTLKDCP